MKLCCRLVRFCPLLVHIPLLESFYGLPTGQQRPSLWFVLIYNPHLLSLMTCQSLYSAIQGFSHVFLSFLTTEDESLVMSREKLSSSVIYSSHLTGVVAPSLQFFLSSPKSLPSRGLRTGKQCKLDPLVLSSCPIS